MSVLTIFLVDDYPLSRISSKNRLESYSDNYKITGDFSNAKDCINAIKTMHPDVILMDLELPGINGIEATKIIKEKYPEIKVIILTSFEDDSKVLASLSVGCDGYIIKGKNDIKKAIDIIIQGGFWIDSKVANKAFSKISVPNIKNLEKLYKYDELKQSLTQREFEVLKYMAEGKTNSQIAKEIIVSTNTIKAHVGNILEKFGAIDRVQAVAMALRANLI